MISLRHVKTSLLDILFPPSCVRCGLEGVWLCEDCKSLVEIWEDQYCHFCAVPRIVPDGKTCRRCARKHKLTGLFCAASYENKILQSLIRQFKYEPKLARCLANPLASFIITHFKLLNKIEFDDWLWVPVPLHRKKLRWRGFNQAAELARELATSFGGELCEDALKKIRETQDQVSLAREKRGTNLAGVFQCKNPATVRQRKILLVDDVFTTGATMEECARVLRAAGAKEVWGVVVARG